MAAAPLSIGFGLPFAEAIAAARKRIPLLPDAYYNAIPDAARRTAWTVSGLASLAQVQNVLDSLNDAQEQGIGFDQWQRDVGDDVQLPQHRLNLIFRQHAQTAYSAGHWREFMNNARERPFLMYSAVNDARTRPAHRAMSGFIARIDDPVWKRWTPPAGYNCRCSLISLTPDQARARGYDTQDHTAVAEPDPGFEGHPIDEEAQALELLTQQVRDLGGVFYAWLANFLGRAPKD